MNNTRFATALHILTLLSMDSVVFRTSEWIAGSINVHPVVVRRELSILKSAGIIESKQGKDGGVRLAKVPEKITLSEVFLAVQSSDLLGKKNQFPNPNCPVGKIMNQELKILFEDTQNLVLDFLNGKTLASFSKKFN